MSLRSRGGATVKRAFVFLVSTVATYSILHYLGGLEGEEEEEGDFITSHASPSFDDVVDAHPHNIRDELHADSNVFMSSASPSPSPPPPVPPTTTTKEEEEEKKWSHSTSMRRKLTAEEIEQGKGKFHVMLTANEQSYVAWQSRIMYQRYLKLLSSEDSGAFGGFTRVLHSERADDLMDEIPSVVVDPLPKGVDEGYVVLNRP